MRTLPALLLIALLTAGCRHKTRVRNAPPPPARIGQTESGVASWYGYPYHGRQAANGEIYDMEQMTAAHRTLPFETWVRVENLGNRKAVDVRITDRGPFVGGRIIDLSRAAARSIDMIGPGTTRVRLVVIRPPATVPVAVYGVQAGAFRDRANAERAREQMAARYGSAVVVLRPGNPDLWRVLVGSEPTQEAALALAERIRQEIGERNAFVVRLDREWLTASSADRR